MANVFVNEESLSDIADSIRGKLGVQTTYKPSEMAAAITSIPSGGSTINNQNKTVHPSSSDQSITADSGYTGLGTVTVKGVTTTNLSAANIVEGVTVKIGDADDDDRIASVTGSASGGITPTGTKTITSNGTGIDVYSYASADVSVPNSYSAGDEGKVVSNGALVSQTSDTVTTNDTYDTTLINSLTVNVSGGGGTDLSGAVLDGSISGAYENSDITSIRTHGLDACSSLTSVSFPNVESVGTNALYNCTNITSANFPKLKSGATYAFAGMTKLTSISLPAMTSALTNFMFNGCKLLKTADIGAGCNGLGGQTFAGCTVLDTVILRRTAGVVSCSNNTFNNTPFASGGSGGTVYVPNDLIASYKAASNWSTLFNAGTCTFVKIEGSAYE